MTLRLISLYQCSYSTVGHIISVGLENGVNRSDILRRGPNRGRDETD